MKFAVAVLLLLQAADAFAPWRASSTNGIGLSPADASLTDGAGTMSKPMSRQNKSALGAGKKSDPFINTPMDNNSDRTPMTGSYETARKTKIPSGPNDFVSSRFERFDKKKYGKNLVDESMDDFVNKFNRASKPEQTDAAVPGFGGQQRIEDPSQKSANQKSPATQVDGKFQRFDRKKYGNSLGGTGTEDKKRDSTPPPSPTKMEESRQSSSSPDSLQYDSRADAYDRILRAKAREQQSQVPPPMQGARQQQKPRQQQPRSTSNERLQVPSQKQIKTPVIPRTSGTSKTPVIPRTSGPSKPRFEPMRSQGDASPPEFVARTRNVEVPSRREVKTPVMPRTRPSEPQFSRPLRSKSDASPPKSPTGGSNNAVPNEEARIYQGRPQQGNVRQPPENARMPPPRQSTPPRPRLGGPPKTVSFASTDGRAPPKSLPRKVKNKSPPTPYPDRMNPPRMMQPGTPRPQRARESAPEKQMQDVFESNMMDLMAPVNKAQPGSDWDEFDLMTPINPTQTGSGWEDEFTPLRPPQPEDDFTIPPPMEASPPMPASVSSANEADKILELQRQIEELKAMVIMTSTSKEQKIEELKATVEKTSNSKEHKIAELKALVEQRTQESTSSKKAQFTVKDYSQNVDQDSQGLKQEGFQGFEQEGVPGFSGYGQGGFAKEYIAPMQGPGYETKKRRGSKNGEMNVEGKSSQEQDLVGNGNAGKQGGGSDEQSKAPGFVGFSGTDWSNGRNG